MMLEDPAWNDSTEEFSIQVDNSNKRLILTISSAAFGKDIGIAISA